MQKHSLTLTRWHKVVERLRDEVKRKEAEIEALEEQTVIDIHVGTHAMKERILKAGMAQRVAFNECLQLMASITKVRCEMAKQNAKLGVTDRLTKVEQINKEIALAQKIIDRNARKTITISDIDFIQGAADANSSHSLFRKSVKALQGDHESEINELVTEKRRQSHGLTDEIADINRSLLTVELDDYCTSVAGLKAHD